MKEQKSLAILKAAETYVLKNLQSLFNYLSKKYY